MSRPRETTPKPPRDATAAGSATAGPEGGGRRVNQKWRTRTALVHAAASLLAAGKQPSIAETADAARISRATAYRYFSSSDELLLEATNEGPLILASEGVAEAIGQSADVAERIDRLVAAFQELVLENETTLRAVLRLALADPSTAEAVRVRSVYRFRERWLEQALEPLRGTLSDEARERLTLALSLCMGTEAHIVLSDIHHVPPDHAQAICRWAANALLSVALQDAAARAAGPDPA